MATSEGRVHGGIEPIETSDCMGNCEADDILRSMTESFDQIHLAADFLLIKEDPETLGPDQQLACLIKDRMARIERQVTRLYRMLQCRNEKHSFLNH